MTLLMYSLFLLGSDETILSPLYIIQLICFVYRFCFSLYTLVGIYRGQYCYVFVGSDSFLSFSIGKQSLPPLDLTRSVLDGMN